MVHVMSEIKRFVANLYQGSELMFFGADVVLTSAHKSALDAQRLRADTAEAELEVLRQQHAEQSCIFCNNSGELLSAVKTERSRGDAAVGDANEAERKLAAAEQRIADLIELLRGAWKYADHDLNVVTVNRELAARIEAALNKKSEGESHE